MMEVVAVGALPVASLTWRERTGAWALTVIAKATFVLAPGTSPLATTQDEPHEVDGFWDDDEQRSVRVASDFAPRKPLAEVTVVGHAFAPGGKPVRSIVARLAVGTIDKSIEAHADRFSEGGSITTTTATRVSLAYERAAWDARWNPIGVRPSPSGRALLPNLTPPGAPPNAFEPIGFGPIATSWPARRDRLRGLEVPTLASMAREPLAPSFDDAFFNAAPPDQTLQTLREGERFVLENLHAQHRRLVTSLEAVRPRAFVDWESAGPQPLAMRADTLAIDTDRGVCTLTWRGHFPLAHASERGRVLVASERGKERLSFQQIALGARALTPQKPAASLAREPARISEETVVVDGDDAHAALALPFAPPSANLAGLRAETSLEGLPFKGASGEPAPRRPSPPPPPPVRRAMPSLARAETLELVPGDDREPVPPPMLAAPPANVDWSAPPLHAIDPKPAPHAPRESEAPPITEAPRDEALLVFSNAAARPLASSPVQEVEAEESPKETQSPEPAPPPAPTHVDVIDLVWFDRSALPRIRKKPAWRLLVQALEDRAPDPELDDASLGSAAEMEDRRDVFEVLALGAALDAEGIEDALASAVRADGKIVPPLVLAKGELRFPFDRVEMLKAHVAVMAPLATGDEKLKTEMTLVKEFLAQPELSCSRSMIEMLSGRLWEAFGRAKRAVLPETLRAHSDSVLLQNRRYERCDVFGASHLRTLLAASATAPPFPTYLPASLASSLPMFQRFEARVVAEVHLAVDEHEEAPTALRVVALARVVKRPRRSTS